MDHKNSVRHQHSHLEGRGPNRTQSRNKLTPRGWVAVGIVGALAATGAIHELGKVADSELNPLTPTEQLAPSQRVDYIVEGESGPMQIAKEFHDGNVTKLSDELQRQANLQGGLKPGEMLEIPLSQINRDNHPPIEHPRI